MIGSAQHAAVTATGAVESRGGQLVSVLLTAGSDAASIILHDNTAGSGTVLCKLAASAANVTAQWTPSRAYIFTNGLYATVSGTGPAATVVYI